MAVVGYEVLQDGVVIAVPTDATLAVTALSAETSYEFDVRAIDAAGNVSALAGAITVTTDMDVQNPGSLPWIEDFAFANGTVVDAGDTAWSFAATDAASGSYGVKDGRMRAVRTRREVTWVSEWIDISETGVANLSMDIQSQGGLDPDDYLSIYYQIDGGAEQLLAERYDNFNDDAVEHIQGLGLQGSTLRWSFAPTKAAVVKYTTGTMCRSWPLIPPVRHRSFPVRLLLGPVMM